MHRGRSSGLPPLSTSKQRAANEPLTNRRHRVRHALGVLSLDLLFSFLPLAGVLTAASVSDILVKRCSAKRSLIKTSA